VSANSSRGVRPRRRDRAPLNPCRDSRQCTECPVTAAPPLLPQPPGVLGLGRTLLERPTHATNGSNGSSSAGWASGVRPARSTPVAAPVPGAIVRAHVLPTLRARHHVIGLERILGTRWLTAQPTSVLLPQHLFADSAMLWPVPDPARWSGRVAGTLFFLGAARAAAVDPVAGVDVPLAAEAEAQDESNPRDQEAPERLERVQRHADLTMLARLAQALSRARAVPLAA
jgi:hypothetical protein